MSCMSIFLLELEAAEECLAEEPGTHASEGGPWLFLNRLEGLKRRGMGTGEIPQWVSMLAEKE